MPKSMAETRAEWASKPTTKQQIEALLENAERGYRDAARMHFQSKCSYEGGRVDALKAVLKIVG